MTTLTNVGLPLPATDPDPRTSGPGYGQQAGAILAALDALVPISVMSRGADPTGAVDAAPGIQQAHDDARDAGGGTVYGHGTFLLASRRGGSTNALLHPHSNVDFFMSPGSKLKVADGMNNATTGSFDVFYPQVWTDAAYRVDNASWHDITIDMNGANNLVPVPSYGPPFTYKSNIAIGIAFGSNLRVENVTVLNNPGQQTFVFGTDSTHTVVDVWIEGCYVHKVGRDISGNTNQTDHSCIYAIVERLHVHNNTFLCDVLQWEACAIESHSVQTVASGNIIRNFANAVIIDAENANQLYSVFSSNTCNNVLRGFWLWTASSFTMQTLVIADNVIIQGDPTAVPSNPLGDNTPLIDLSSANSTGIAQVDIHGNSLAATGAAGIANYSYGIDVGQVQKVSIEDNTFLGLLGPALRVLNALAHSDLTFNNNRVYDCCRTGTAGHTYAVEFNQSGGLGSGKILDFSYQNNTIANSTTVYMTGFLVSNQDIGVGKIKGNRTTNLSTPELAMPGPAGTVGYLEVDHVGSGDPESNVRASADSVWTDRTTGYTYTKKSSAAAGTGWRKRFYATVKPTTGTHRQGDYAENTAPAEAGAGGSKYWIAGWMCTVAGTSGTWLDDRRLSGN